MCSAGVTSSVSRALWRSTLPLSIPAPSRIQVSASGSASGVRLYRCACHSWRPSQQLVHQAADLPRGGAVQCQFARQATCRHALSKDDALAYLGLQRRQRLVGQGAACFPAITVVLTRRLMANTVLWA